MNKYARRENFADRIRTPLVREHYVYRPFNAIGELLYVGCTARLEDRMKAHRNTNDWWSDMEYMRLAGPFNYETAREVEREAIYTERPLYNYTPERRAIARAHSAIVCRQMALNEDAGMEWPDYFHSAQDLASSLVPYPGNRHPFRIEDGDAFKARAADRAHAAGCAA